MFEHILGYHYQAYRKAFVAGRLLEAFLEQREMDKLYEAMCDAGLATRLVIA